MVSYTFAFAVMIICLTISFHYYILQTSKKISEMNRVEMARKSIKVIESHLDDLENVALRAATDPRMIRAFTLAKDGNEEENYFETNLLAGIDTASVLTSLNGPNPLVNRIIAYNNQMDFVMTGDSVSEKHKEIKLKDAAKTNYLGNLKQSLDYSIVLALSDSWSGSTSSAYIVLQCPIMNPNASKIYGIIEAKQNIKKLQELLFIDSQMNVGQVLTAPNGLEVFVNTPAYNAKSKVSEVIETSDKYGWSVKVYQDSKSSMNLYQPLIISVYLVGLLLIIVMSTVIGIIADKLCTPLVQLKQMVNEITLENVPKTEIGQQVNDEVKELNQAFNAMTARIVNSIELEKRANLLAMQAQMNPHFMYNVLTVISSAGMECGNDSVVKMCNSMSDMLRYIASYEETTVTFMQELANTKRYLELMKFRYEDYFEYSIEADDSINPISVPKLILQPLVENCFSHGFSECEPPYIITIQAKANTDKWYVKIIDNGKYISEEEKLVIHTNIHETLDHMEHKINDLKIGGLGLVSTIIRLKLNSKSEIEYAIEDNELGGTTVTIYGVW